MRVSAECFVICGFKFIKTLNVSTISDGEKEIKLSEEQLEDYYSESGIFSGLSCIYNPNTDEGAFGIIRGLVSGCGVAELDLGFLYQNPKIVNFGSQFRMAFIPKYYLVGNLK